MGRKSQNIVSSTPKKPKQVFSYRKVQEILSDPKLNLTAVAREVGVGGAFLYNISQGLRPCTMRALEGLCHAFNKTPDWFFEDEAVVNQTRLAIGAVANAS